MPGVNGGLLLSQILLLPLTMPLPLGSLPPTMSLPLGSLPLTISPIHIVAFLLIVSGN